ncbi:CynX/NimT family MFS transporter [Pseudonocardia humida]|uniref:MFS transporter n=1 Tax=Pseudonocardia humida TaxID=2800819 RepID=A0ABT1AAX8_9PSEU|nr:MFS transporter [Pseudonocardia humida]MCO1659794.1 MFS transporter [Pseudonocardia humida]
MSELASEPAAPPARTAVRWSAVWFAVSIVLVAANLRPAVVAVGPLLGEIQADQGLSGTAAGVLTALPVLCFGLLAPLAPVAARRVGIERVLLGAVLVLCAGIAVRSAGGVVALFAGTVLLGAGIAVGNVLLPSLVKRDFPERTGLMTGLYSMAITSGATLAAGVTVPVAQAVGLQWRGALAMWLVFAGVALLSWLPHVRRSDRPARTGASRAGGLWRDPVAWQVTIYMGLQSLSFFAVVAWLPALLVARGFEPVVAGWLLSLATACGIVGATVAPLLAARSHRQRAVVLVTTGMAAAGLLGLLLVRGGEVLWVALLGAAQSAALGIALTLVGVRAPDAERAAQLSGMAQSAGYVLAAAGPFAVGFAHDVTGGWTVPLLLLLALLVLQGSAGVLAARDRMVAAPARPG